MERSNNMKKNFARIISSITQSYTYLEGNREELRNASIELEFEMVALYKLSKDFASGRITIDQFRRGVINLVTKETDQLIVVDENGKEITAEQKALQNSIVLNSYDRKDLVNFAINFYRTLSASRNFVYYKLNGEALVLVMGSNMMPSDLTVFDDKSNNIESQDI